MRRSMEIFLIGLTRCGWPPGRIESSLAEIGRDETARAIGIDKDKLRQVVVAYGIERRKEYG